MCYMTNKERDLLVTAITDLVAARKMFTGYDVGLHAVAVRVSEKVRALFNQHDCCFQGYGCYPVEGGPLLYFPVSKSVQNRADKIQSAIMDKADEMPEDDNE